MGAVPDDATAPLIDPLAKLVEWLRNFKQLVYREAQAERQPEVGYTAEEEEATGLNRQAHPCPDLPQRLAKSRKIFLTQAPACFLSHSIN
jgi:hypothetical protein